MDKVSNEAWRFVPVKVIKSQSRSSDELHSADLQTSDIYKHNTGTGQL